MGLLGNSPERLTTFRLELRKSFSFSMRIQDAKCKPVDVTDYRFTFVMKQPPFQYSDLEDLTNIIVNSEGILEDPTKGFIRFNFQASDLNVKPGEYPYAIVMNSPDEYSSVIVKGVAQLVENTEFSSLEGTYMDDPPTTNVDVLLRKNNVVDVRVGHVPPPGYHYISDLDRKHLDSLVNLILDGPGLGSAAFRNEQYFAIAAAGVPTGGGPGRVLAKRTGSDYDMIWRTIPPSAGGGVGPDTGLDATGIPEGQVPRADGVDGWEWQYPTSYANDIQDRGGKVIMTDAERAKLSGVEEGAQANIQSDWELGGGPGAILNKPDLGTAALEDADSFASANHTHRVIELNGISRGDTPPSGGVDGDIYLQYLP